MKRWSRLYAFSAVILTVVAWPHLFIKGQVPVDGNTLRLFYPNWVFLHSHPPSLWHWPLWNPFRNMGEPFLADPQSLAAYPPMWLLCRVPDYLDFTRLWVLGHTLLAGYFIGKWVLGLTNDLVAAFVAAIVMVFNGYFMAHGTLPNHFASAAYVPAALYFFESDRVIALGFTLALQWLAGFPPFSFITGLALIAWSFCAGSSKRLVLWKSGWIAVGLAAYQVVPFAELLAHSSRPVFLDPSSAAAFSEPWSQLLRMLFIPQWYAWQPQLAGDPAVVSFYLGPFVILCAGWAVWKGSARERSVGWAILLGFILSMGPFLPGGQLLMIRLFRFPANWLLVSMTGMALLSGLGVSHIKIPKWKWITTGLVLADLLAFAQYARVAWFPPSFLTDPPPLVQTLNALPHVGRIYHAPVVTQSLAGRDLKGIEDYQFLKESLTASYGMAFGLREVESYQVLKLKRAERYQARLAAEGPNSPLLRWAGVSAVITRTAGGSWGPQNLRVISVRNSELPLFFPEKSSVAHVEELSYEAGNISARAETDQTKALVFSEVACPGWGVFVDGKRKALDIFQETFLAVSVPAGVHEVEFRFFSLSFWFGWAISLGMVLSLIFRPRGVFR
jgi:hypothetical protein